MVVVLLLASDLVLYVAVAEFQTEQVLEWFAKRLVEVEVRQLGVCSQHARD